MREGDWVSQGSPVGLPKKIFRWSQHPLAISSPLAIGWPLIRCALSGPPLTLTLNPGSLWGGAPGCGHYSLTLQSSINRSATACLSKQFLLLVMNERWWCIEAAWASYPAIATSHFSRGMLCVMLHVPCPGSPAPLGLCYMLSGLKCLVRGAWCLVPGAVPGAADGLDTRGPGGDGGTIFDCLAGALDRPWLE